MTPPSEAELAGARRFTLRPGIPGPVDAVWHVLADGRVLVQRPSGGWERSVFTAEDVTADGSDWVAKEQQ